MRRPLRELALPGLAGALVLLLTWAPAHADFHPQDWEYQREIGPARQSGVKYAQVDLDRDVYCRSRSNLADLRIIDGAGKEISYAVITDEARSESTDYTPKMLNKSDLPGRYNVFVLDLGKPGRLNNMVNISSSNSNFMYKVEVSGSDDLSNWAVLRKDGYIFVFSEVDGEKNTAVDYPENVYRYIQVKVWHYNDTPLSNIGATVHRIRTQPAREMAVYRGVGSITQNVREQSTDIVIDTGCRGLMAERAVISSPDVNYRREVEVLGSNDRADWSSMGQGYILKYLTATLKGEESSIAFWNSGYRYVLVRIRNADNRPLRISRVTLYSLKRQLLFPYAGTGGLRLYYGNSAARTPSYDIEQLLRYLPTKTAPMLKLGPESRNPAFTIQVGSALWVDRHQWIFWIVLSICVLLLAALTIRLLRQMQK